MNWKTFLEWIKRSQKFESIDELSFFEAFFCYFFIEHYINEIQY